MKIFFLLAVLAVVMANTIFAQQIPPIEAGVSRDLARWRAANYSDVRYKLNLTLEKMSPLMKGSIEIRVKLTAEGAKNDLILDWRTTQFANDKDKPFANVAAVNEAADFRTLEQNEHLVIPKSLLKTGENVIAIQFASPIKTSGAAVTRYVDKEDGAEYIYSLFVPSDASTAFPCFDQPDLKAEFRLEVLAPKEWKVISNSESLTMGGSTLNGVPIPKDSYLHFFSTKKPISTYVFAFAAGDFSLFSESDFSKDLTKFSEPRKKFLVQTDKNTPNLEGTQIYVRKSQAEKFKQHTAEVFRLNREAVKYLEGYFDYKFPFPKYDLVLIPEFPFGGMEHAGATFLRESSVIFPQEPTANDYISRGNLIFHEAAHQWFGDTVTMRWFDDLWLKEGFAEFMAYKTMEKVLPQYNAWKAFYERNKPLAYLTDSTKGTTPIYQEIPNLSSAKSAYGNIVYRKAPAFLRQAEFYLGEKEFQTAVRAFLKQNAFKNAEWQDLVKSFETATNKDLKDWTNVWVTKRGLPVIRVELEDGDFKMGSPQDAKASVVLLGQKDLLDEKSFWQMKLNVLTNRVGGEKVEHQFQFSKESQDSDLVTFAVRSKGVEKGRINFVFPNYQDYGYGIFLLDKQSRDYVLANIQNEKDDFLRAMMWGALWDSVREGELAPRDYVELAIKNIGTETDELTIQTILGRVGTALNYYLSETERNRVLPRLENLLLEKMKNSIMSGERIIYYRAFLSNAQSPAARKILKIVLKGERYIVRGTFQKLPTGGGYPPGAAFVLSLPQLRTKDKFDIVTRLSILNDADALTLLAELEKTETSDEAKRYAYAARAGIATAENKQKYFNDFISNKEISESWIESAFAPFNSPRHAALTQPFLEKALQELPNLKRNRKIFFVNGWLAAFIGGQRDEKSLAVINKFLADNPNLDKDLRLKILEVADGLERSLKIRKQYN